MVSCQAWWEPSQKNAWYSMPKDWAVCWAASDHSWKISEEAICIT